MPEASIGRLVHYVHEHGCRPAQIVAVFDQGSGPPLLNLVVTLDGRNDGALGHDHRIPGEQPSGAHLRTGDGPILLHDWQTSVPHAEPFTDPDVVPQLVPATWHWPERTA